MFFPHEVWNWNKIFCVLFMHIKLMPCNVWWSRKKSRGLIHRCADENAFDGKYGFAFYCSSLFDNQKYRTEMHKKRFRKQIRPLQGLADPYCPQYVRSQGLHADTKACGTHDVLMPSLRRCFFGIDGVSVLAVWLSQNTTIPAWFTIPDEYQQSASRFRKGRRSASKSFWQHHHLPPFSFWVEKRLHPWAFLKSFGSA